MNIRIHALEFLLAFGAASLGSFGINNAYAERIIIRQEEVLLEMEGNKRGYRIKTHCEIEPLSEKETEKYRIMLHLIEGLDKSMEKEFEMLPDTNPEYFSKG